MHPLSHAHTIPLSHLSLYSEINKIGNSYEGTLSVTSKDSQRKQQQRPLQQKGQRQQQQRQQQYPEHNHRQKQQKQTEQELQQ